MCFIVLQLHHFVWSVVNNNRDDIAVLWTWRRCFRGGGGYGRVHLGIVFECVFSGCEPSVIPLRLQGMLHISTQHLAALCVRLNSIPAEQSATFPKQFKIVNERYVVKIAGSLKPGVEAKKSAKKVFSTT